MGKIYTVKHEIQLELVSLDYVGKVFSALNTIIKLVPEVSLGDLRQHLDGVDSEPTKIGAKIEGDRVRLSVAQMLTERMFQVTLDDECGRHSYFEPSEEDEAIDTLDNNAAILRLRNDQFGYGDLEVHFFDEHGIGDETYADIWDVNNFFVGPRLVVE